MSRLNRHNRGFRWVAWFDAACVIAIIASVPAFCQSAANQPSFDVVSVKISTPESRPGGGCLPLLVGCRRGSQWAATNAFLQGILQDAYQLNGTQLVGIPVWAETARFDIEARVSPEVTNAQFRLMEQALLADRFHMVAHRDFRDLLAYTLRAATGGLKFQPSQGPCTVAGSPDAQPPPCGRLGLILERTKTGELTGTAALILRNISMKDLVSYLESIFDSEGAPVVDDTGFTAIFDLNLTFYVSPPAPNDRAASDDFNLELLRQVQKAFHDQVGLDVDLMRPTKRSVPILVVDRVSMPSPN